MAPANAMPSQANEDVATVCAISVLAGIVANLVHEALGHAATALLTGARSGTLSTVAWTSSVDSKLVAASGTLANLVAALVIGIALVTLKKASSQWRFFLLISFAFNLFDGAGYFLFSGFTDFGDWAAVIAGLTPHWLLRTALVVVGATSYYGAALIVGVGLVRYVGVVRNDSRRLRNLTLIPYFSVVLLASAAGLQNPHGMKLLWQSALPATAGGHSGLLWLRYYIPNRTIPRRPSDAIYRNYLWISLAVLLAALFIFVLGRGITLRAA